MQNFIFLFLPVNCFYLIKISKENEIKKEIIFCILLNTETSSSLPTKSTILLNNKGKCSKCNCLYTLVFCFIYKANTFLNNMAFETYTGSGILYQSGLFNKALAKLRENPEAGMVKWLSQFPIWVNSNIFQITENKMRI